MPSANFRFVGPQFFRTLGVTVREGRPFRDEERDPDRPRRCSSPSQRPRSCGRAEDPLGRRFSRGIPNEQGFEVVGVAPTRAPRCSMTLSR